jgi:hypothetical protein
MTPKKKAKELFNKMYFSEDQDGFHSMNKYRPKQCALIAVNLAIEVETNIFKAKVHKSYWRAVKHEIEKL